MQIGIDFITGQCTPPTDRSPEKGPHGEHGAPYTKAELDGFKAGNNMFEHSKLNFTATIKDPKRGTGPENEITPEDVARLAEAGTPVGPITFTVNGEPAAPTSANDSNRFNTRVDVTGVPTCVIAVECEGVTDSLTLHTVRPPFPTVKE